MTLNRRAREEHLQLRAAQREANIRALATPSAALHRGTYAGTTAAAAPKTARYRDQALLDMAEGQPCLLLVPDVCNRRTETTVACHSNLSFHGKAGARKADDVYTVWGCAACHRWLDFGTASHAQKEQAFMGAHLRQVLAWREIATGTWPERFRRAARRALDRLDAR